MLKTKFLLPAAAALLALAACSKTETIEAPAPNAIGFNVLQDNALATKGTVMSSSNAAAKGNSFKVWGFHTDGSTQTQYLPISESNGTYSADASGLTVSYSVNSSTTGNGWGYSGSPYYWPTYALDFYAIWAGKDGSVVTTASTNPEKTEVVADVNTTNKQFKYTVPTEVNKQLDVMTAYKQQQYSTSNGTNVELNFNHALSQIIFSAKTDAPYLTATVSEIQLVNIKSGKGATFTIQSTGDNAGKVSVSGTLATDASYTAVLNKETTSTPATTYAEVSYVQGNASEITSTSNELILFPQTLTDESTVGTGTVSYTAPASTDTYPYVSVKYSLTDTRNNASIASNEVSYIPLTGKWESGKKYNYILTIGPGAANIITFTATVSDWVTDTNPVTDVRGSI